MKYGVIHKPSGHIRGRGFAKCPYCYILSLISHKIVHKGGGGQKCPKICPRRLWKTPMQLARVRLKIIDLAFWNLQKNFKLSICFQGNFKELIGFSRPMWWGHLAYAKKILLKEHEPYLTFYGKSIMYSVVTLVTAKSLEISRSHI